MRHSFFLFFPLFLACLAGAGGGSLLAQKQGQPRIDSLLKELSKSREDTNKVKLLNTVALSYYALNPDEGLKYGQQELSLAEKQQWEKGMAMGCNALGVCYMGKPDYDKALEYYFKALKINQASGNSNGISNNFKNIALVYMKQINYPKALEYYGKALKVNEQMGNKENIGMIELNIGNIYTYRSDYPKALEYYFKALNVREELGNKNDIANIETDIGLVYNSQNNYPKALEYDLKALKMDEEIGNKADAAKITGNIGVVYMHQSNYSVALAYFFKALNINKELGNKEVQWSNTHNIGLVYMHQGNYPKALAADFIALKIGEELGDKRLIALTLNSTGVCYLDIAKNTTGTIKTDSLIPIGKTANLQNAINYFKKDIILSKEIGDLENLQDVSKYLSEAQALLGKYKDALESYKQFVTVKDSVFSNDNKVKIANEGTKRAEELGQKQIEINKEIAAKKRLEQLFFISGLIVLAIIIIIIFRNNKLLSFEKKKSDGLLLNILPEEVADELKETGTAHAKLYEPVTVFFSDFVSFTTVSERLTPQELVAELHACFKGFDEIIKKYDIEKIKTVGDAYLMVSGLPTKNPDHATDMIAAAIEIRDFMVKRKAELGDNTFGVRIGVNSGSVVAGIVGVTKFAYDIWGDTVNTAARMEQNSQAGRINISESTYLLVKDKYDCEYRGKVAAKNKGEIDMYFVSRKELAALPGLYDSITAAS